MGLFSWLFGKSKSSKPDPVSLDPQSTIQRLVEQQVEAAARGERIVNRFPASLRQGYLVSDVVKRLRQLNYEEVGIPPAVAAKIEKIDLEGTMAAIQDGFGAALPDLPKSVLREIEAQARADDATSSRPKYDDLDPLIPSA